jgi:hypothetical protein
MMHITLQENMYLFCTAKFGRFCDKIGRFLAALGDFATKLGDFFGSVWAHRFIEMWK